MVLNFERYGFFCSEFVVIFFVEGGVIEMVFSLLFLVVFRGDFGDEED